ncbi:MAG: glycosyltransferase [Bacteroidetes bacterium]|nr:glycosyltransferase [Bacteroidota bacterium]
MNTQHQSSSPLIQQRAKVMLAHVSYPVTTAAYFERVLRDRHQVVTIGPTMDRSLIKAWRLENMRLPIKDQDIPTAYDVDMAALFRKLPSALLPDLYLWVESVNGHFPRNLDALTIPKACYLIDTHLNLDWHVQWARQFDHVFIAQREYLQAFRDAGNRTVHWLPLGCDPEIHRNHASGKTHDIGFVGSLNTERRVKLLNRIEQRHRVTYERCFWTDMADFFSRSKIVFNNAIKNDLNMRVFEVLSSGSFLLTDTARNSGQETLFHAGEELGVYTDDTILEVLEHYLAHEDVREEVAARGRRVVHRAHTYAHRMEDLLQVCLGGKPTTDSAEVLREKSVAGESSPAGHSRPSAVSSSGPQRSFVIPVLDMSPASPYNIMTLLDDLRQIEGDVIVVCNAPEMADRLRTHPRIDYLAAMSHNVGVSRAWNIGLAMSQSPMTFILNADLHVESSTFTLLEQAMADLPDAAVVGPQGSYFDFATTRDMHYLDKGACSAPVRVDAVSGFLFGVRTAMFGPGGLQFDARYTPCYFEEWDLGLQCRWAGVACYVVPATGYDHEWSGTIRGLRTIRYFRSEATARQILERNRQLFLDKWKGIAARAGSTAFLESLWNDVSKSAGIERASRVVEKIT